MCLLCGKRFGLGTLKLAIQTSFLSQGDPYFEWMKTLKKWSDKYKAKEKDAESEE